MSWTKLINNLLKNKLIPIKYHLKIFKNNELIRNFCSFNFSNSENSDKFKNSSWNILFFGTDEFSLKSLKKLNQEYRSKRLLNRLEVVTIYDGRENPVIKYAQDNLIKLHQWPLKLPILDFDIGLVVSFGHLIPSKIIESFPLGMINVHASLLPRWRGAAPIIYALMNGDEKTGVTIMKIAPKKFDIGEILGQREICINLHETQPELHEKLANLGGDFLIETIEKLPDIINCGKIQSNKNVTYAPKIKKDISIVKWEEMTANEIYNLQRALTGIFPLKTTFQGQFLKIFGILPVKSSNDIKMKLNPGIVFYNKEKEVIMVQCKQGDWVSIEEILLPGKRKMSAVDFNNGYIKNRRDKTIFFGEKKEKIVNKLLRDKL